MSKTRPVAIVLGGVTNHILLIEHLKKRGFYTILVDYLDDPPAKAAADEHAQISTFDESAIEQLARERDARLIINANLEHVNAVAIRISEKLGLPVPYSSETALNVSQKDRMKQIMVEGGVPTTSFVCLSEYDSDAINELALPVFIKPADGSGSKGVNRAETYEEIEPLFELAKSFSQSGKVIVEEEASGKECSVYTFISGGKAQVLLVAERLVEMGDGNSLTRCLATITPADISKKAFETIKTAASRIASSFALETTPMFMQVKVNSIEVNVIEFACRMAGGYSFKTVEKTTGFDMFEGTVSAFLREPVNVPVTRTEKPMAICSLLSRPGIFDHVEGIESLVEQGLCASFLQVRSRGAIFNSENANGQRVGFFLVCADNRSSLISKIRLCTSGVKVISADGADLSIKDSCSRIS